MRADLHTHSYCSDGTLSPENIAELAKSGGVELVAVTDHDSMEACAELEAFAKSKGIKTVNGLEVSAYDGRIKFHTLGYNIDIEKFRPFLKRLYESSIVRTEDILNKLNAIGKDLTWDDVNEQRYSLSAPIHSRHIARAMVKRGFCKNEQQFFKKYIAYGKPAFSCIHRPTPEEACREICAAGGFASLAHPGRIQMERDELEKKISVLKDNGLCGIEVYYTTHTQEETAYYKKLALSFGLLPTGGSDTHNLIGTRKVGIPYFDAEGKLLEKLGID